MASKLDNLPPNLYLLAYDEFSRCDNRVPLIRCNVISFLILPADCFAGVILKPDLNIVQSAYEGVMYNYSNSNVAQEIKFKVKTNFATLEDTDLFSTSRTCEWCLHMYLSYTSAFGRSMYLPVHCSNFFASIFHRFVSPVERVCMRMLLNGNLECLRSIPEIWRCISFKCDMYVFIPRNLSDKCTSP